MIDQLWRAFLAARQFEGDHGLGRLERMSKKLRGGARVLPRPVEFLFERNAGFGEHLGAGAAETVDKRAVAEVQRRAPAAPLAKSGGRDSRDGTRAEGAEGSAVGSRR